MAETSDRTFSEISLYGSDRWAAARLGLGWESFRKRRDEFEAEGFPKRDPVTGLLLKESVDRWARRMLPPDRVHPVAQKKVDLNAL
jgi:hypothetical protein